MAGPTDALRETVDELRAARERLARRDPRDVAGVLERVVALWLAVDSPWMKRAVDELSEVGVFSRPMLEYALPRMIAPLAGGALEELVCRELGGWRTIEDGSGPGLILHVLPSNLPGHAAIPSALTLLLRAAALLKPGRDDRSFAATWIGSIRAVDRELGECVDAVYWPGGSRELENEAMATADLVVAAGSDVAIDELRARCTTRFIGHGSRISIAMVAGESLDHGAARSLAEDIAVWDQLGCLSPQVCFVEGDLATARTFGEKLRGSLEGLASALPPGRLSTAEILAERRFRDEAAWRGFATGEVDLFSVASDPGAGSVAIETEPSLRPTPLHRCVRIVAVEALEDSFPIVAARHERVEAVGVAADVVRFEEIAASLRAAGLAHVVRLGQMQKPDLAWRQGKRPRIAEWCGVQ